MLIDEQQLSKLTFKKLVRQLKRELQRSKNKTKQLEDDLSKLQSEYTTLLDKYKNETMVCDWCCNKHCTCFE